MLNDEDRENIDLIQRMASRDTKALDIFYDRYNRLVFSLVLRIVRTREDAEDIVVDVFWQIWQQSVRYDKSRGRPLAWLLTIARTRAIDGLRSIRRQPSRNTSASEQEDRRINNRQEAPV